MKISQLPTEEIIKKHWSDPDFIKIREAFLHYVACNFDTDYPYNLEDKYIAALCELLGVDMANSDDGYDTWWELDEPYLAEFVAKFMKDKKLHK